MTLLTALRTPPTFCQCAGGACDQSFNFVNATRGTFLYPSQPEVIAKTIEGAVAVLRHADRRVVWRTWREFAVPGQTVFCEICRQMRFADFLVADVTTLNFNLLFEIGFALGLGRPVVPIRDASFITHKIEFEQLGLIDTLGYIDFKNAAELAEQIRSGMPFAVNHAPEARLNTQQPLYVVKGHLNTEADVRLLSILKKSRLRIRTFDVAETPRLSLYEARRQVGMSLGVIAHLLDENRQDARVHNARCALIAGIATASNKAVLLLQEGTAKQPIDYRDVVVPYTDPTNLERYLEPFFRTVMDRLQDATPSPSDAPQQRLLEQLNLGDVAAENEIFALKSYFVRTSQYHDAQRGSGRLVTGRKGAGKTAIFYAVRHSVPDTSGHLVLDLKPEGYQFTTLREAVLSKLSEGLQGHTLMAFWEYLLLCEMAQKIVDKDYVWAQRDESRRKHFERIKAVYEKQPSADAGDFSERLLTLVDVLVRRFEARAIEEIETPGWLTELLFRHDLRELNDAMAPYLREKEAAWILVDNLDKGWPTRGAAPADVLIIRTLLDATRKLQRQFDQRNASLTVLVFLRNDIYDLLVRQTPDRGKDTQIALDWDDIELFREIIRTRIVKSTALRGNFDEVWTRLFDAHVGVQDSFGYILDRTLMRPRDLLSFVKRATETAINRRHDRVLEDDIRTAEKSYSEDMLAAMSFELRDIYDGYGEILYVFSRQPTVLSLEAVKELLSVELQPDRTDTMVETLVWFGFLGVLEAGRVDPVFAYNVRYNIDKLLAPVKRSGANFSIHPAFHRALDSL